MLEQAAPQQIGPIRDALSQLQLAFVRIGGSPRPGGRRAPPEGEPGAGGGEPSGGGSLEPAVASQASRGADPAASKPGEAGPAQRSGRLWVPGQ